MTLVGAAVGAGGDLRWLEQRARGWYVVKDVPRPLRASLGKKRWVKSLGTRDVHVARSRRHAALAAFELEVSKARTATQASPLVVAGMEWRDTLTRIKGGDAALIAASLGGPNAPDNHPWSDPREEALWTARGDLADAIERIEEEQGPAARALVSDIANGRATPVSHYVPAWLAEGGAKGPLKERTKAQYRSDVSALEAWAKSAGIAPTTEAVTKKIAGRYVTEALVANGIDRKTANRKISAASAYWRWLVKRGVVEANPWAGQSLTKMARHEGSTDGPRPFAEAEVRALLTGNADPELHDAMRAAALSGMRIEELYRLTVEDCADGWFRIRQAKTRAGVRRVPIHSAVSAIVAQRTEGKAKGDYLFPEPGKARVGRERSMAASKRFGHYRKRLGIAERAEGQRQSRVTFHSFRRWFVTMARAGFDLAVVQAVVGHDTGNLTDDVYSGGPSEEAKRACVESVRLPEGP